MHVYLIKCYIYIYLYGKIPLFYVQNFPVYIQENFEDAKEVIRSCISSE